MIAIIDYGMGNLRSVQKAFEHLNVKCCVTHDLKKIENASKLVLPGVGAFRDCMQNLEEKKLIEPILKGIQSGKPFLGICLGMQVLLTESEEFGSHKGLNVIPGKVLRFPQSEALKVPHMGWNSIKKLPAAKGSPLQDIEDSAYVYFVHSYYVVPEDKKIISTTTPYGFDFCSSLHQDNIFATQFHPEKSQEIGLKILEGFAQTKE
ncbi:MAG: imidazole glycerol phosphate synthase subunit HisH [Deltaproteobacteria bacterium]|nr:imidazole glycerol phosphate synthase subunit HisH [Deltaproteobacteria bacterium]